MSLPASGENEIPSCHGGLENLDSEYDYDLLEMEGSIPADIKGTFFRNGPGRQKIGSCYARLPLMRAGHIFVIATCERPNTWMKLLRRRCFTGDLALRLKAACLPIYSRCQPIRQIPAASTTAAICSR